MKFADQIAKALRIRIDVDVTPARAFVVGAILGGLLPVPMLDELSAAERFVLLAAQSLIAGGIAAYFSAERERQTSPGHRSVRLLCPLVSLGIERHDMAKSDLARAGVEREPAQDIHPAAAHR